VRRNLWRELWILAGLIALGLAIGLIASHPFLLSVIGLVVYIALQLRQMRRLHEWLLSDQRGEAPDAAGLWGDVYTEIRKLVRQGDRHTDALTDMLMRFQSAAAAMPDAMVILSEHEEIELVNPAAARLLGLRHPRDIGVRIANLIRDPDFAAYLSRRNFAEALEIPSPRDPDQTISIQVITFSARRKLVIGRDVTRVTRLEQMRRTFVANVSHELRTPITVLSGYLETLRGIDHLQAEEMKKHFATMHEQATRMQRLVDDLLMLSRLETEPPRHKEEVIDVATLLAGLREQAEIISGAAKHRLTLEADPQVRLRGSREELYSAFMNIVQNAVRYTLPGGAITLRWEHNSDAGQDARISREHRDVRSDGANFSVTDSGDGIATEHIPRLTERFYRVDTGRSRASGGTGLGLSIVKHVLLRHDAELRVESEIGKGSTFICAFPEARVVIVGSGKKS
jgi:two-component system, OmpR family, phosphate regulon sensor histidine kinase PhoR